MRTIDKFHTVSEVIDAASLAPHPNYDMIVEKPFLFYYVKKGNEEEIQKNGIPDPNLNGVDVFFERVPEIEKYRDFLASHVPVKISVSKLIKSSENVRVRGVNFPKYEGKEIPLKEADLEKLAKKGDIFYKYFEQATVLEEVPHAKIYFETGVIPSFAFKVLGEEDE